MSYHNNAVKFVPRGGHNETNMEVDQQFHSASENSENSTAYSTSQNSGTVEGQGRNQQESGKQASLKKERIARRKFVLMALLATSVGLVLGVSCMTVSEVVGAQHFQQKLAGAEVRQQNTSPSRQEEGASVKAQIAADQAGHAADNEELRRLMEQMRVDRDQNQEIRVPDKGTQKKGSPSLLAASTVSFVVALACMILAAALSSSDEEKLTVMQKLEKLAGEYPVYAGVLNVLSSYLLVRGCCWCCSSKEQPEPVPDLSIIDPSEGARSIPDGAGPPAAPPGDVFYATGAQVQQSDVVKLSAAVYPFPAAGKVMRIVSADGTVPEEIVSASKLPADRTGTVQEWNAADGPDGTVKVTFASKNWLPWKTATADEEAFTAWIPVSELEKDGPGLLDGVSAARGGLGMPPAMRAL